MRVIVGAAVAALAMLVIGFLIHATPLSGLGSGNVGNQEAAQLQSAMALNMPSTGTYRVPDPNTAEQTVMFGQGPIATIHYNTQRHSANDPMRFAYAFFLNFLVALIIGAALVGLDRHVTDFGMRARLAALFGVAAAAFIHLSRPILFHVDWSHAIFSFIADGLTLAVAGIVVAWFTPKIRQKAPADAPTEV